MAPEQQLPDDYRQLHDEYQQLKADYEQLCLMFDNMGQGYEEALNLYDQAVESSRMKSDFIQQISHEIRTPLNILSGFTQILTSGMELDEAMKQEVSQGIADNTQRITGLVNKMLELAEANSQAEIARDDDVLVALSIGGDDYVKKPYSLSVLLAKVKVNLKRAQQLKMVPSGEREEEPCDQVLALDPSTMSAIRNGTRIELKAKEYSLLKALYDHRNTIVTKEQLFDEVWGDSFYGDGTLNVHIRKLREKLEDDPTDPKIIKTVWGTGYILEV